MFVSRSDISADGQAMTAANGSRALSPVSLATAGRENRTCQMENVNYSGCGGERCCEQRRRAAVGGAGLRRGWGGCPAAPGRQQESDNARQQTGAVGCWAEGCGMRDAGLEAVGCRAVGCGAALLHPQFCQAQPTPVAPWLSDPPSRSRAP